MARFPSIPGAGAKRIGNPVYWARMDLQHSRYRQQSFAAVQRFNERLQRLRKIQNMVSDDYVDGLVSGQDSLTMKEDDNLADRIEDMQSWATAISENVDIANNGHLSKYATRVKTVAMTAIKLCMKYEVYDDIDSVMYQAKRKMILLNGEDFFFFG